MNYEHAFRQLLKTNNMSSTEPNAKLGSHNPKKKNYVTLLSWGQPVL